jgi:hypothetical protein
VGVGATNAIVVDNTGKVGIGKADPAVALDVTGNVRCSGGYNLNYSNVPTYSNNQIGFIIGATYTSSFNWQSGIYTAGPTLHISNLTEGIWLFTVSFQYNSLSSSGYKQIISNFWTDTTAGAGTRTEFPQGYNFCLVAAGFYAGHTLSFPFRVTDTCKSWTCQTNATGDEVYAAHAQAVRIA